jgi:predicted RNase H-like nuclease (RuvC/YqgF family)
MKYLNSEFDPLERLEQTITATNNNTASIQNVVNACNQMNQNITYLVEQVNSLSGLVAQQQARIYQLENKQCQ